LSFSKRFSDHGFSATEFHLTMSRGDIANQLGLAVETVSRLFSRFHKKGLITILSKRIVLRDIAEIKGLCG
jgi:CRP/FNR family transcriptional regulator